MCICLLSGVLDLLKGGFRTRDPDILKQCLAEQLDILRDVRDRTTYRCVGILVEVDTVHINLAALRLIILEQEFGDGRFAAAAAADQRHLLPLRDGEGDVIQCGAAVAISERDIFEFDVAFDLFHLGVFFIFGLFRFIIHDLGQALHGDIGFLNRHLHRDQVAHRRSKVTGQRGKCHIAAQCQLTIQHLHDAHVSGHHIQQSGNHHRDQRLAGADLAGPEADLQALDVLAFQSFQLAVFAGIALDGLNAAQALDHLTVQHCGLLHRLFIDPLVRLLEDDDEKQTQRGAEQGEREQRGVHPEQHDANAYGHHHVHHDGHRDVGQDRFDGACIGVTGGDLTGLPRCEELHRQFVHMLEVAQHQRNVDPDGQEDQDPLANRAEQVAREVDHAEHKDQGDE